MQHVSRWRQWAAAQKLAHCRSLVAIAPARDSVMPGQPEGRRAALDDFLTRLGETP